MQYFLFPPGRDPSSPTLLFVGSHNFLQQRSLPPYIPHAHANLVQFLYFSEGSGMCTINGRNHPVRRGDLVIHNASTLHLDHFGLTYFCGAANIHLSELPPKIQLPLKASPVFHLDSHESIFQHLLSSMTEIAAFNEETAAESCQLLFRVFLNQVVHLITSKQVLEQDSPDDSLPLKTTGEKIQDYVDQHILDRLSLSEIADHFQLSTFYVSRIFKLTTGYTLSAYQARGRIGHAQTLLLTTNLSLAEIAEILGYTKQGHFSKQFMEITGIKPSQYRKQLGGQRVGK